jgi:hypothetical protein
MWTEFVERSMAGLMNTMVYPQVPYKSRNFLTPARGARVTRPWLIIGGTDHNTVVLNSRMFWRLFSNGIYNRVTDYKHPFFAERSQNKLQFHIIPEYKTLHKYCWVDNRYCANLRVAPRSILFTKHGTVTLFKSPMSTLII